MISIANKGILYPENPKISVVRENRKTDLPAFIETPNRAWQFCRNELEDIFQNLGICNPTQIIVMGKLRKGCLSFEDRFKIYTNSDCPFFDGLTNRTSTKNNFSTILEKNDNICSEEFCAEILLPFCDAYFPNVPVCQFLVAEKFVKSRGGKSLFSENIVPYENFVRTLATENPQTIFFFSEEIYKPNLKWLLGHQEKSN